MLWDIGGTQRTTLEFFAPFQGAISSGTQTHKLIPLACLAKTFSHWAIPPGLDDDFFPASSSSFSSSFFLKYMVQLLGFCCSNRTTKNDDISSNSKQSKVRRSFKVTWEG